MGDAQLGILREALTAAQGISDDRGYQAWAGIHGLPLPMYCQHGTALFLPWHRAYLYFFEKTLQDRVAGVTLPWWDWTTEHDVGVPAPFAAEQVAGQANPLFSAPIQPSGREPNGPDHTARQPAGPDTGSLPDPAQVAGVLALDDFLDFQTQLEDIHNHIHVWVGGTMSDIATAAYDPLFWAHHAMIDRIWRLWQLAHSASGPPATLIAQALPPFPMTVSQTLDMTALGYDYAAATAGAPGPGAS